VPASLKLQETFKDSLTVIFVECQGLDSHGAESFAYSRQWMNTQAMWTTERPFSTGSRGLPNFALLSNEGKVLLKGHPGRMHQQIEEAIRKEIQRAKKGPENLPKPLRKAWAEFAKGKYASALGAARKLAQGDGAEAESAKNTVEALEARIHSQIDCLSRMIEEGQFKKAEDPLGTLAKACKGLEEFEARVTGLKEKLASPEMKAEVAADEALFKLENKIKSQGLEGRLIKQLKVFISKHEGTRAMARAQHLLDLAEG
jgi:hypothetical protein